ncbi:hypothetical protein B005_1010 [Nocardiopsis alba ATCC BAA-2165]|uniref:Uncharacterized protein n=1 Tax=Nocardiopsis alba (strain ATCC BAA-2165 / BE74) TaxID=1205910 RepID=J7L9H7_NOCAA|nr:hypothetical protein B005_1010 [Nocardiopsis alba ATCC BAA-2165]
MCGASLGAWPSLPHAALVVRTRRGVRRPHPERPPSRRRGVPAGGPACGGRGGRRGVRARWSSHRV